MSDRARRNAAVDGLRAIAALSVFGFHAWLYTLSDVRVASGRGSSALDSVAAELRIGLVLFFVLSGYLLFRPWVAARLGDGTAPRTATYAVHRLGRIVPAYWLAIAGSVLLLWPLSGEPGVRLPPAGQLPLFFVFLQNRSPDTVMTLDPPMWTLAVEAAFYAVLPLLGALALRARPTKAAQAAVPLAALALGVAWNWWLSGHDDLATTWSKSLPAMLPYFAVGMLAAIALQGRAALGRGATAALMLAGLALVAGDMVVHAHADAGTTLALRLRIVRDLPAAIGFAFLLAVAVARPPALLAWRPLAWAGGISYGLYLWHVPLLLWLRAHDLIPGGDPLGAVLVGLPLSLLAGWLSFRFVERPAIAWSRRTRRLGANPVSPATPRSAGTAPGRTRSSEPDAEPSPPGSPPRHARV